MPETFRFDARDFDRRRRAFRPELNRALIGVTHFMAPRSENYMKQHAPWTDRTSNARNSLNARPGHAGPAHWIDLAHGVPYGFWLEVRFGGRHAIVVPTLRVMGRETMRTMRTLLRRMH